MDDHSENINAKKLTEENSPKQESLGTKAIKGAIWTYIQQFGAIGIQLIITMVLSRLLEPSEFGMLGMLYIFIQISNALIQGGMTQSLIRVKHIDEEDLSTVFYFNLGISIILYFILILISPLIALFYKEPLLERLIKVYALVFVINALGMVQIAMLNRAMEFRKQTFISIISIIVNGITGITLAFLGFGVWALVFGQIASTIVANILYWFQSNWRPAFIFSKARFKNHFHFGYKLSLTSVNNIIFQNLYILIIGRLFNPTLTGYYVQAVRFRDLPINALSNSLNKVSYPLFTKYENNDDLREVFRKITITVIYFVSPLMVFISVFSSEIIQVFFSSKWLPAAPYLSLLCFAGILIPIHAFNLNILLSKGRSDLFFKLSLIKKSILLLMILLTYPYGIIGLIVGQLLNSIISIPINAYYINRFLGYTLIKQLADLIPSIIISLGIGFLFYLLKPNLAHLSNHIIMLCIGGVLFASLYIGLSVLFKLNGIRHSTELLRNKILNNKKLNIGNG